MLESLGLIAIGILIGFVAANWHLEMRIAAVEDRATAERQRAERAIDALAQQRGSPPISEEAVVEVRAARQHVRQTASELALMYADEIGTDDEGQTVPLMPERDPLGKVRA